MEYASWAFPVSLQSGSSPEPVEIKGEFMRPSSISKNIARNVSFSSAFQHAGGSVAKLVGWKRASAVFLLCATTAIVASAQTFTTLHSFDGTDGSQSQGGLVQALNGLLYGTAPFGGAAGDGTIFNITLDGTLRTVDSFNGTDGTSPWNALVQGTDGNFYGTTSNGGANGFGTVFKINQGTVTTLHSFTNHDGTTPQGGLVQGSDGNFYGTTLYGAFGYGTVFKIAPSGTFTTLHKFSGGAQDGGYLYPALIQATDGNFYGVTWGGGHYGGGTVFRITPAGTVTTLHDFCSVVSCPDGEKAVGGLVQGSDGNLYGTTARGGNNSCNEGCGTVFQIALSGTLTTLHLFNGGDGYSPFGSLVQGTDGILYGLTPFGGTNNSCVDGCGTIFSITTSGTLTTLYNFCSQAGCTDGATPVEVGGLIQDTDGTFYGTTALGGNSNVGTVFSLSVGLGPFVKTLPPSGRVGAAVRILGTNLTGATSVTFNGTAATFNVVAPSFIVTHVPTGATTGNVQVVTPGGTLTSNVPFRVKP